MDYLKKSVAYQGAILWNSLDNESRSSGSHKILKNSFKKQDFIKYIVLVKTTYYIHDYINSAVYNIVIIIVIIVIIIIIIIIIKYEIQVIFQLVKKVMWRKNNQ